MSNSLDDMKQLAIDHLDEFKRKIITREIEVHSILSSTSKPFEFSMTFKGRMLK